MRELNMLGGNFVAPIGAPMDRDDCNVAPALGRSHPLHDLCCCRLRKLGDEIDPGALDGGAPCTRYPARGHTDRHEADAAAACKLDDRRATRPDDVPPRPRRLETGGLQCIERLGQRSEEHTSELQSPCNLVCRLLLEKKKKD